MKIFENIITKLGLTKNLKDLIFNKIHIPILNEYNCISNYWYPHPPCLIPLFQGLGASYKGIVHHFFCNRKNTLVASYLENAYMSEIARNENQLFTLLILKMIVTKDDLSNEIINFSNEINFNKLKEVDEFSNKYGDDPKHFNELIYYDKNTPLIYIKDISLYDGDYPSSLTILNHYVINDACKFEISDDKLLADVKELPIWLEDQNNKKELFMQFISKNKLKEAWLTLNSKGWLLKDVAESLNILKNKSNDSLLHMVADNWINNWEKSKLMSNSQY